MELSRPPDLGVVMALPIDVLLVLAASLMSFGGGEDRPRVLQQAITGSELVAQIAAADAGQADVDLTALRITGTVDLRSLRQIDRPLRCLRCTFEGEIIASDVVFSSVIELTETTFKADVAAHGATFEDGVVFDGARFEGRLDLTGAQFVGVASFDRTDIEGAASFDRALFTARTVFTAASSERSRGGQCSGTVGRFADAVTFRGTLFSDDALFRQRCFGGRASFDGASFGSYSDFTLTTYHEDVSFRRVTFDAGTSFVVSIFQARASFSAASLAGRGEFEDVTVGADLDFSFASGPGLVLLHDLRLSSLNRHPLGLTDVTLAGLSMDLDLVQYIRGVDAPIEALALIEKTARSAGDTATANDAHFDLLDRQNAQLDQPRRFLDAVFYGGVAGYLVNPWHPIIALFVVAIIGTLARAQPTWRRAFRRRPRRPVLIGQELIDGLVHGAHDTLAQSWSIRSRPSLATVRAAPKRRWFRPYASNASRWGEWFVVKILLAVTLLCIANASPTIRQLIDSIF